MWTIVTQLYTHRRLTFRLLVNKHKPAFCLTIILMVKKKLSQKNYHFKISIRYLLFFILINIILFIEVDST